jgi:redox-sensitive bicupin YhaK (pirin superfamily)
MSMLARQSETVPAGREIIHRTRGHAGGPITRLVSPSDLGQIIKPFVFLDRFEFGGGHPPPSLDHGWHPHSGIATVTVVLEGALRYAETTGQEGVLPAGSVEWMKAGNGVWHTGTTESGRVRGFQLWVALPPELESTPSASHYVMPDEVEVAGPARVILGAYGNAKSPIASPPMNYLAVSLQAGERWAYDPPAGHDVTWIAVMDGGLRTPAPVGQGELAIFDGSEHRGTSLDLVAEGATRFVLGSASRHPHELVLGDYSVHTSAEALRRGDTEIRRIGRELRAEGKQSYALRTH